MKKIVLYCVLSALIGGSIAAWLVDNNNSLFPGSVAQAQELRAPGTTAPIMPAALSANPGLTDEEITNIRVYDGCNRGVVNVLVRTVSYDGFFRVPTTGEGAGSGSSGGADEAGSSVE